MLIQNETLIFQSIKKEFLLTFLVPHQLLWLITLCGFFWILLCHYSIHKLTNLLFIILRFSCCIRGVKWASWIDVGQFKMDWVNKWVGYWPARKLLRLIWVGLRWIKLCVISQLAQLLSSFNWYVLFSSELFNYLIRIFFFCNCHI